MQQTSKDGTRSRDRQDARKASLGLRGAATHESVRNLLTDDELDWLYILMDRLADIGRHMETE